MYLYDRACLSLQTVGFLLSAIIAVLCRMLMRMAMKLGHNAFFFCVSVCKEAVGVVGGV